MATSELRIKTLVLNQLINPRQEEVKDMLEAYLSAAGAKSATGLGNKIACSYEGITANIVIKTRPSLWWDLLWSRRFDPGELVAKIEYLETPKETETAGKLIGIIVGYPSYLAQK